MKIGVISDTHIPSRCPKLPDEVFSIFSDVDLIIHCGDINDISVIDELESIAKTLSVRGNTDILDLSEELSFKIGNFNIGVIHGHQIVPRGDLLKMKYYALEKNWDILISGHTHTPLIEKINCENGKYIYLLNPGSVGEPRYSPKTVMKIEIDENNNLIEPKLYVIR